jgi:hypothetical protein
MGQLISPLGKTQLLPHVNRQHLLLTPSTGMYFQVLSVDDECFGEVPEWLIGAVSKTVERGFLLPGFESLPLRH